MVVVGGSPARTPTPPCAMFVDAHYEFSVSPVRAYSECPRLVRATARHLRAQVGLVRS